MSPTTNLSLAACSGSRFDGGEVGSVAGVGELVEDRDAGPVAASEYVADKARADEARPAGDQQPRETGLARFGHEVGLAGGAERRPARDSCSASSAARISDVTVPASVQCPSYSGA